MRRIGWIFVVVVLAVVGVQSDLYSGQKKINYQGKLTDASGNPIDSSGQPITVTFRLYNVPSGGAALWTENQGVVFTSGLFNVSLGSVSSLDNLLCNEQYYLGIQVAGDQEMSPRQPLNASAYALGSLGDFNIGRGLSIAGGAAVNGSDFSVGGSTIVVKAGKVGIGNASPAAKLSIQGTGDQHAFIVSTDSMSDVGNLTVTNWGYVGIGTKFPAKRFEVTSDGVNWISGVFNGGPAGSDKLVLGSYSGKAAIGAHNGALNAWTDLIMQFGGGRVGIGTSNPQVSFHVANSVQIGPFAPWADASGRFNVSGACAEISFVKRELSSWPVDPVPGDRYAWYNSNGKASLWTDDIGDLITITSAGKLGIGTTNPAYHLHVHGDVGENASGAIMATGNNGFVGWGDRSLYPGDNANRWGWYAVGGITHLWDNKNTTNRISITNGGNVGIGTTNPSCRLHVGGEIMADSSLYITSGNGYKPGGGSWSYWSDIRLKKNVEPLSGALGKMLMLRGVTYEFIEPKKYGGLDYEQIGVIAQEVEKVFPKWVDTDREGYKTVTFRGFEALTVEAVRELKAENDSLRSQLAELKKEVADLKGQIK